MTSGLSDTRAAPDASTIPAAQPAAVGLAVMLATAPAVDGRPAALLPWDDGTVVGRLAEQLTGLGVAAPLVITRPAFVPALQEAVGPSAEVRASASVADDLRLIARAARDAAGQVLVLSGDLVTHTEALEGVIANPHAGTRILAGGRRRSLAFRFQARRGRLVERRVAVPRRAQPQRRRSSACCAPSPATSRRLRPRPSDWRARRRCAGRVAGGARPQERRWRGARAAAPAPARRRAATTSPGLTKPRTPTTRRRRTAAAGALRRGRGALAHARRRGARGRDGAAARRPRARPTSTSARLPAAAVLGAPAVAGAVGRAPPSASPDYDEDRLLLDSAVKSTDGFFTTFFVSPYSKYIARWAARRGFTPNQVTTVSMALGVLAAAAFATGERVGLVAGAVLLQIAFTTDCVDGQLARYTRQFSKLGAWLDSMFDRTKEYLAFAGLAIGAAPHGRPGVGARVRGDHAADRPPHVGLLVHGGRSTRR